MITITGKPEKLWEYTQKRAGFFTVHMGWWKDEEEPFKAQWETFLKNTKSLMEKKRNIPVGHGRF